MNAYVVDLADANLTGFASNVTGATFTLTANAATDGLAHQVSIRNDSATDHAGKTVTLTGTDQDGRELVEIVTGPGTSATVESAGYFKTLTSAVPSATIGSDTFDIGWVDEVATQTIPLNWRGGTVALNATVTGTINYTVQQTFSNIQDPDAHPFDWDDHDDSNLVSATATMNGNYIAIPRAVRLKVNSYSSGAAVTFNVSQSDV